MSYVIITCHHSLYQWVITVTYANHVFVNQVKRKEKENMENMTCFVCLFVSS